MITGFAVRAVLWDKEDSVIAGGGIIKAAMNRRGYKHRATEDQLTIRGEYARNLQYVYSKETMTSDGVVVDLVYFAVDVLAERLVIGLYRENSKKSKKAAKKEDSVYANAARSIGLSKLTREKLDRELDKLITPVRGRFK
jgi:hypothetical protein